MDNTKFERKPLARWVAFALAATAVAGIAHAAAPLAGTEIKNLATVTYEDENGNKYSAQSNEAIITVAPQYRATLENDKVLTAAPGSTVYFPHTLENIGNSEDTYDLTTIATSAGVSVNAGVKIFKDINSNGQPDAGEPEITKLTLAAGKTGSIIISYVIPATAVDGDVTDIKLTATSTQTGAVVKDIGLNGDGDTDDGAATNDDKVTVGSGPILVLNKESVIDEANRKITYTLTVKNTGSSAAAHVDILDALPKVDTNNDGTLNAQTTLVAGSIVTNGLLDTGDTAAVSTDETTLAVDVDGDGVTDGTMVIRAHDMELAPNTTISVEYSVTYEDTWAAEANIDNQFIAFEDTDPRNPAVNPPTNPPKSNKTHDEVPQNYGVLATDDREDTPSAGVNDGNDDFTATTDPDNDIQFVDTIASGDTVIFTHTIENTGNGDDKFNLSAVTPAGSTGFPSGTVFTFWNADGTVQLTDSDGDNVPDTGVLGQLETKQIVIKADLPSGASKEGVSSTATLTATSSADPAATANKQSDDTTLTLGEITAPAVDLSAIGATQSNKGFNDADKELNAHNEGPVFLKAGLVGGTVVFPMSVANEAGSPDSFLLGFDKLPEGWSVTFKDKSGGNGDGDTITSTPFIPAGGTFNYDAIVTISSTPAQALANADNLALPNDPNRANDVDGHDTTDDGVANMSDADGIVGHEDKDYVIEFTVASAVDSTRNDSISHAVDVADVKSIQITPDGQNQIQPGGTVDYPHKLSNEGNVDEAVELTSDNNDPDWSSRTLVKDNNGTLVEVTNLKDGDQVEVQNPDGSTVLVAVTDVDADGKVEFPLKPGQYINVVDKVFGPSDAAQGEVNTTTLTVRDPSVPDSEIRSSAEDNTNVILGQVRLTKTVALDKNCDSEVDAGESFAEIQASKVEPGQCAIWQILAKNEGDTLVKNVIVNDSIPAYTNYFAGSLRVDGAVVTDAASDDAGEYNSNANKITYYLGANANYATSKGGDLPSGETSIVKFTVQVEE
ncbi:MAG: hypothetical protein KAG20_00865 [Cocleimonas sp.]|nr:hypothetical protein [Cocleimonas sp.]